MFAYNKQGLVTLLAFWLFIFSPAANAVEPTADAGPDQSVIEGAIVTLDGSASLDPDGGSITSYSWTETTATGVSLTGNGTVNPTFTAPAGPTTVSFSLVVTDSASEVSINLSSVTITVSAAPNVIPTANAGPDQSVVEGVTVNLDGSGSSDSDGTISSYAWIQALGPGVSLTGASTVNPSFTAPAGPTTLSFDLVVTDDDGDDSIADNVVITVSAAPNVIPTANAGPDQSVAEFTTVVLDGSGSSDSDGTISSYTWSQIGGPDVVLSGATTVNPEFTSPIGPATLTFSLVVSDNDGDDSIADNVVITVSAVANVIPIANAGPDQSVVELTTVVLDGSGSNDSDGTISGYDWSQTSGPTVTLVGATTVSPSFSAPEGAATLEFSLVVTDNDAAESIADSVSISISEAPNIAPTADAGPNQSVAEFTTVILDGSGSSDSDGTISSYAWSQTGGAAVTLSGATTVNPEFTSPIGPATLTFTLVVTDNGGAESTADSVSISVSATNIAPTADAGPNQSVEEGATVTLDGSGSSDSDGSISSYAWSQTAGPAVTLVGASTASPSFSAPAVAATLTFSLVVTDNDGDSSVADSVSISVTLAVDNTPPVVTAPTNITVSSSGLYTLINYGVATAVDDWDGDLPSKHDSGVYLKPGRHVVTWSATDKAGNTGTDEQIVNVIPRVEFTASQVSAEGSSLSVRLALNGVAATYPVTVPFTVSGTATPGADHSLSNGVISISSGTVGVVNFNTFTDVETEGTETIILSMGNISNAVAGKQLSHTVELVEGNVAPRVVLSAAQGNGTTHIVSQEESAVTVSAVVIDSNAGDVHSFDWSETDNSLVDTDGDVSDGQFRFNPNSVTPGIYTLQVSVNDGEANADAELMLKVLAETPQLSATNDSDNDGVADAIEGYGDADNDGIADYLDAIGTGNVLQGQAADRLLMEAETGLTLSLGNVAFQAGVSQAGVSAEDVTDYGNGQGASADELSNHGGLFDFMISGLPEVGESARVVLPQLNAIPANAVYRKLLPTGWVDFSVDSNNQISSAPGAQGYCPPPGDAAYTPELTSGHWCVQLLIEDGGPNDADAKANQRIYDPGGVAQLPNVEQEETVTVRVDSSGGAWHPLMLLLAVFFRALWIRAKDKKI